MVGQVQCERDAGEEGRERLRWKWWWWCGWWLKGRKGTRGRSGGGRMDKEEVVLVGGAAVGMGEC